MQQAIKHLNAFYLHAFSFLCPTFQKTLFHPTGLSGRDGKPSRAHGWATAVEPPRRATAAQKSIVFTMPCGNRSL